MQTRFALLRFAHPEIDTPTHVLAIVCGQRFFAMRISGPNAPVQLPMREGATRFDMFKYFGVGTGLLRNTEAPFQVIADGLRLHTHLHQRAAHSFAAQSDWTLFSAPEEMSLDDIMRGEVSASAAFQLLTRMLAMTHEGGIASNYGERMPRITRVLAAKSMRIGGAVPTWMASSAEFRSMNLHGIEYKGQQYDVWSGGTYVMRRNHMQRIGAMIRACVGASRRGEDNEGLLEDLDEVLMSLDEATLGTAQAQKIDVVAEEIGSAARLRACGHFHVEAYDVRVEGSMELWCENCRDSDARYAEDVGEWRPTGELFYSERRDEWFTYDIDADEDEDEDDDLEHEVDRNGDPAIYDYSTNVSRILRKDVTIKSSPYGDFLMGLELELTTGTSPRSRVTAAKEIRKQLGLDYCIFKSDGSLPEDGIELVTAPRGLREHITILSKWNIDPGYRAWDTNRCGLHVHIHSRAFTEMTLGKFLMFINLDTNADFIRKLAGRHPFTDTWAARYCAQEGMEVLENPKAAVKGKSNERYRMINVQNLGRQEAERLGLDPHSYGGRYDTIELRVFKASLKKERMLAQVEFAHAAVMFCRVASYRDLSGGMFLKWLRTNTALYPHLADWYGVRKSKAIKDHAGMPLAATCTDRVVGDVTPPERIIRSTRRGRLPSGINDYLTPKQRADAVAARLREAVEKQRERLRRAREQAAQLANDPF